METGKPLPLVYGWFVQAIYHPEQENDPSENNQENLITHLPPPALWFSTPVSLSATRREIKNRLCPNDAEGGEAHMSRVVLRQAGRLNETRTFVPRSRPRFTLIGTVNIQLCNPIYTTCRAFSQGRKPLLMRAA